MLGFSPISSRAISGSPFSLVATTALLAGSASLTFTASATWGARVRMAGSASLSFAVSGTWTTLNAMSGATSISFTGAGLLKLAGRPIVFYAVPDRHSFIATAERPTFTARPDNFTFRGMR